MYGGVRDVGEPKWCGVLIPLLQGVRQHVVKGRVNSLQTLTLRTIHVHLVLISVILGYCPIHVICPYRVRIPTTLMRV